MILVTTNATTARLWLSPTLERPARRGSPGSGCRKAPGTPAVPTASPPPSLRALPAGSSRTAPVLAPGRSRNRQHESDHLLSVGLHQGNPGGRGSGVWIMLGTPVRHFH